MRLLARVMCLFFTALVAMQATLFVDKLPNIGPWWHPLSGAGTYVYADSFVFTGGPSSAATTLGVYLLNYESGTAGTSIRFELWGDSSNAPDPANVLGVTGYFQDAGTSLHLVTADLSNPVTLTSGSRYWVIASAVGQTNQGAYQVGAHAQNSIYADNGTFWYANDPSGISFDGPYPVEMAIYVAGSDIPEPGTLLLLGAGLAYVVLKRRRAA
jgi:hypothetical protein